MPVPTISNQTELTLYKNELAATKKESEELKYFNDQLEIEKIELRDRIKQYNDKNKNKRATEEAIEQYAVTPAVRLGWTVLLGAGIIIKETVKVTTAVLDTFLFPLHFAIDGVRSMWDIYRITRDKTIAQRKTKLGANIFNVVGLAAAATVVGLAVTNPFALPVVFLGLVSAGLYKDAYVLRQTKKQIAQSKLEKHLVHKSIEEVKHSIDIAEQTGGDTNALDARMQKLKAKDARLDAQLTHLHGEQSELKRGLFFHTTGTIAVGLLVTSAVLSLILPPAAVAVAGAGLLLFAATAIANVMTSPPVVAKIKKAANWFKNLFSGQNDAEPVSPSNAYQPLNGNDNAATVAANKIATVRAAPTSAPAKKVAYKSQRSHSVSSYFDERARQHFSANAATFNPAREEKTPAFSK